MTKKLEDELNMMTMKEALGKIDEVNDSEEPTQEEITHALANAKKINNQLGPMDQLKSTDNKFDEYSALAKASYQDLMELGMNVEDRVAGEIFSSAVSMLKNAITAQSQKANTRLKAVEIELKRIKLDYDMRKDNVRVVGEEDEFQVLDRNELHKRLSGDK